MDLKSLRKPKLLELARELGLDVSDKLRKPELLRAILELEAEDDELSECLETIEEREQKEKDECERKEQKEKDERECKQQKEKEECERKEQKEKEERDHALEMKRLEVEMERARNGSQAHGAGERVSFKMTDLMRPFKLGEDIGLFLVNFERTCEKQGFSRETWPQRLLTLLPGEAADVVARLKREEAEDFDQVKSSLLKKYRLSAEAFRRKFRENEKGRSESYTEFAYRLMSNMQEWLKEEKAFGDHEKILQCFGLEQFYSRLPENVRYWVLDRPDVSTVAKAAELAEEFVTRRARGAKDGQKGEFGSKSERPKFTPMRARGDTRSADASESSPTERKETAAAEAERRKRFETRQARVCYTCQKPGHFSAQCPETKTKVVFLSLCSTDENMKLLEPYMRDFLVNGKECRVLRDSAATMDVVHPSYVEPDMFTGECAWIKQAVEAHSVCLPVAKVVIEGPFGAIETEAAVSSMLPPQYPYLFSNRSDHLLREKGLLFGEASVQALTRSRVRELAAKAVVAGPTLSNNEKGSEAQQADIQSTSELNKIEPVALKAPGTGEETPDTGKLEELSADLLIAPTSDGLNRLLKVSRSALIAEQKKDGSLENMRCNVKEGIAKKNARFVERGGVLYRKYLDRRGVEFDQLIVPQCYRQDLLRLSHGGSCSGHLGVKKTKDRLLQEYYWPGCFRDVEHFVRTCDTCQRVGKPGDKSRAPLKLVPIITEPFRRLVIDTVGPLPVTATGYRHILTVICPATKFPEAVPLKDLSSVEIVNALLSIFARVGFPAEIQSDQGTVFTSALTTAFLERCGVKLLHSSVYHPQSNSVEKLHSVMKRVLRALCFQQQSDWELCLPGVMFALRTAPHAATGFSPAELVYGRSLRSPLRMLRDSWEGRGDDPVVVEYVLSLLERLRRAQELSGEAMAKAQQRAKVYYDRTARARRFEVGDEVMVLRTSLKNKLDVQWEGPARIVQKLSDVNYVVSLPGKRKAQQVYHCNLLKPYRQREAVVCMMVNVPEELPVELPGLGSVTNREDTDQVISDLIIKAPLSAEQKTELHQLLQEFQGQFSERPGRTSVLTHDIELTSPEPVRSKAYRVSPRQRDIMEAEVKKMLQLGVIEAGESDYTSPLILVEVPGKEPRPCVDYRRLNSITKDQIYPIPNIEERLEKVSSAQFISTLDLVRGYWQVPLTEEASRYAAFISPMGTFRPKVLSFGLKNAPYCFSSLMDKVLRGQEEFALPYLDDVAIFSASWSEHMAHLRAVLTRLREADLTVKAPKCQLAQAEVVYLGHVIGQGRRRPSEIKVAAVRDFPQPRTKTDIRSFLGVAGYYQRYIPRYSDIAAPLTDALRKTEPQTVAWSETKERAFSALKSALTSQPVLRSPDYTKGFVVQCDASERGMGVVLCQRENGEVEHPVLYASRKLTCREQAYSATEKECACLV
ncbi:hypothetical protein V5799_014060 [Amblyomma americanum]|uniref:RNA-directed DNA polymerase n=1 Tax=Amblyomma americanum TaxID=6943 RepID=A0AAQ4E446_AMBAM